MGQKEQSENPGEFVLFDLHLLIYGPWRGHMLSYTHALYWSSHPPLSLRTECIIEQKQQQNKQRIGYWDPNTIYGRLKIQVTSDQSPATPCDANVATLLLQS